MKKLILSCIILLCTLNNIKAQNAPLNKQQTLEYIEKVFKECYKVDETSTKPERVVLDNKILQVNLSSGKKSRVELLSNQPLLIKKDPTFDRYHIGYNNVNQYILYCISTESDAKRLKKALEHLIEILKTEKNTDPFGE
jgi:hypothetical protein